MPTVSNEEFYEELRREKEKRATWLADAKVEATKRGKEPFDLTKLEIMCDTSSEGRLDPVEERQARFEYLYYVQHPELMTLEELAQHIERTSKW